LSLLEEGSNISLRIKRFRRLFRPFQAFFTFSPRENWGERLKMEALLLGFF